METHFLARLIAELIGITLDKERTSFWLHFIRDERATRNNDGNRHGKRITNEHGSVFVVSGFVVFLFSNNL